MDAQAQLERLERAYAVGDHRTARALARELLRTQLPAEQEERARRVLRETEWDPFLTIVGALGLGLLGWLVYNYVL